MGGYGEALWGYKVYAGGGRPKGADMAPRTIEEIEKDNHSARQNRLLDRRTAHLNGKANVSFLIGSWGIAGNSKRSPAVEALLRPLTERKVGAK